MKDMSNQNCKNKMSVHSLLVLQLYKVRKNGGKQFNVWWGATRSQAEAAPVAMLREVWE